ncbi:YkgJ family cysteine cluster protein [Sulfuricurvum sp.]|uniref:YkgJ family cysteine cluster protein n=1 Tax=Sulfuricurvum sp. TaxID=2025608 RepID=UPI002D2E9337|nr:YkgJ family cysteine cluster protein [Sulfuricurvum sp.]HZF71240.1 YkgJ family cysteine cluster protein [Sulfuricurvum sp.]
MFPCSNCGLCCRNIDKVKELNEFDLGNGTCKYLDIFSNFCIIYDTRPDICNIDKMFEKEYKAYFDKKEFYILNANVCNHLQYESGLDKKFKIQIGE